MENETYYWDGRNILPFSTAFPRASYYKSDKCSFLGAVIMQNQSPLGHTRFPALGAGYVYLLRVLIGSLCSLRVSWLAIVIAWVLVVRLSVGNRLKYSRGFCVKLGDSTKYLLT